MRAPSRRPPRFERIAAGAQLVHWRPRRLPPQVTVPLVLGSLAAAGALLFVEWTSGRRDLLALVTEGPPGANVALLASPWLAVGLALTRFRRRYVVRVAPDAVSWWAGLGRARRVPLTALLELEQRDDHVRLVLRDGTVERVPMPGPSIATSSLLAVIRQGRASLVDTGRER